MATRNVPCVCQTTRDSGIRLGTPIMMGMSKDKRKNGRRRKWWMEAACEGRYTGRWTGREERSYVIPELDVINVSLTSYDVYLYFRHVYISVLSSGNINVQNNLRKSLRQCVTSTRTFTGDVSYNLSCYWRTIVLLSLVKRSHSAHVN